MDVELINVGSLFDKFHFEPAKVQRQFVWHVKEAALLLEDLLSSFETDPERAYYLGPILLAKAREPGKALVFDGQQRITTLTILMAAFGRTTVLEKHQSRKQRAQRLSAHQRRPRLDLQTFGGALTRVVNGTHQRGLSKNTVADHHIYDIEREFLRRLTTIKEAGQFFDWLTKKAVLSVLWADQKQGLTLFDRANNRGIRLEWHELVKGVISEALDYHSLPSAEFSEQWYRTQREAGREFEDLLWSIAIWRYGELIPKGAMDKYWAQAAFEDDFGANESKANIETRAKDFLDQLKSCRHSSEKLNAIRSKDSMFEGEPALAQLMFLEFSEWRPVGYWLLINKANNADGGLKKLRRAAYIAHLLGWQSRPKWLSEFFLRQLDHERNSQSAYAFSDEQLAQARGTLRAAMTDSSQYRPLVKLYESQLAFSVGPLSPRQIYLAHVEHILPRAPRGAWLERFPDEDQRAELRGHLGNFCLLPKHINEDLGNDEWPRKRQAYRAVDSCFKGAIDAASHAEWNVRAIVERTGRMAAYLDDLLELSPSAKHVGRGNYTDDEIPF
jgi:hypothetical protein